jgi:NAD(P)-dependent dehydrogenase (short-subunit alcohol dehydrogenase family)
VTAVHVPTSRDGGLLAGKVAAITGAARGIGFAVAQAFARHGASVALIDVAQGPVEAAAASLRDDGAQALAIAADVTSPEDMRAAAATAARQFGRVDCAVANAGVLLLRHVADMDVSEWRRVIDINLTGAFITCKTFANRFTAQSGGGRLILTSSLFGLRGGVENGAYSASKFGMIGLMESLAAELAPAGILVNAVCPGQIRTEMMTQLAGDRAELTGRTPEAVIGSLIARIPLGRLGDLGEVADAYVYLASDLSSYVTGQTIVVDGGWQVS